MYHGTKKLNVLKIRFRFHVTFEICKYRIYSGYLCILTCYTFVRANWDALELTCFNDDENKRGPRGIKS